MTWMAYLTPGDLAAHSDWAQGPHWLHTGPHNRPSATAFGPHYLHLSWDWAIGPLHGDSSPSPGNYTTFPSTGWIYPQKSSFLICLLVFFCRYCLFYWRSAHVWWRSTCITLLHVRLFGVLRILPDLLLTNTCKSYRLLACVHQIHSISNFSFYKHTLILTSLNNSSKVYYCHCFRFIQDKRHNSVFEMVEITF